jgi:Zn-dependent peptidase ImmA (M78 family)/transcriptional regulator with XRE-family HTH domain
MTYGDRIRQARELLGWTQDELARKIGVTQPVIAQLEAGVYEGRELTSAIAFKTGFPPSFFSDPYIEDFPLGSLQFRGHTRMMRRDRQQAYRYGQLLFELYRRVSMNLKRPSLRLPRILNGDHVQAAIATRSAMGLAPDTPIKNLVNSAEQIGVVILGLPVALEGRDAFSAWAEETPVIALVAGRPGDRIRLNVAHELGHLVLHQALRGTMKTLEKEAFSFGAELLLPQAAMFRELLPPVTLTTLAPMKLKWKVSLQALIMRARELRVISERQSYYLFEQIGRSGYRIAEPENLSVPIEKPRGLRQMVEMRYGRPPDYRKLAADTKLTPLMLQRIMGVHAEGRRVLATSLRRPSS